MADEEVWQEGKANQPGGAGPGLGEADYSGGFDGNTAFSVEAVFKYGVAVLQEQPALALLGGVNFFALSFGVGMLGSGLQLGIAGGAVGGDLDADMAEAVGQLASAGVQLLAWPLQQLVMAGLMVAGAAYVRSGEVSLASLYTSVGPAVKALLAGLAAGFALVASACVFLAPATLAGVGLVAMEQPGAAIGLAVLLGIPGFGALVWASLGLQLAPYAAVIDDLWPFEALSAAWQAADGARVTLFVTNFAFGILGLLSACMCSIPLIVVVPIQVIGFCAGWLRYSRPDTTSWDFFERNP